MMANLLLRKASKLKAEKDLSHRVNGRDGAQSDNLGGVWGRLYGAVWGCIMRERGRLW